MLKCWHIDANERPTLDSVLNILDNNSINQSNFELHRILFWTLTWFKFSFKEIKDIQIPEIVNDLKNRRSIYIRKSKTRSFFPQARVSFQDIIPQEQITISSEVLGEGVHGFVLKGCACDCKKLLINAAVAINRSTEIWRQRRRSCHENSQSTFVH